MILRAMKVGNNYRLEVNTNDTWSTCIASFYDPNCECTCFVLQGDWDDDYIVVTDRPSSAWFVERFIGLGIE